MLSTKLKEAAGNSADATLYVDDVFSTYLYTGNASTQTITNGIDLAGKGGLVWGKVRSNADNHMLMDSARGYNKNLSSNITNPQTTSTPAGISANSDGFSLTTSNGLNESGWTYASWTFRKAAKFFDVVTYTGTGSARTIAHSLGVAPGMVIVKRTDTTGNWQVYSNGLTSAAYSIQLNLTNAQASAPTVWNSTAPTSSVFSVGTDASVNASGGTYVAYLFAHDTSSTGIIQCGSYVGNGMTAGPNITLGWEPQYVLRKNASNARGGPDGDGSWDICDSMRGMSQTSCPFLLANSSAAENTSTVTTGFIIPNATGFVDTYTYPGDTYIYMAIRMPNKPPTSGAQVYNAIARTGTGTDPQSVTSVGFTPDWFLSKQVLSLNNPNSSIVDRLRGRACALKPYDTVAELVTTNTTADLISFDMNGVTLGFSYYLALNASGSPYINYFFKRAPGFFDVVCVTTSGYAVTANHNLGVVPELIIGKDRNGVGAWIVWNKDVAAVNSQYTLKLNTNSAQANNGMPINTVTSTTFYAAIAGASVVNQVFYLFATLAGIQYINSYVGDGTTGRVINCGFSAGARFICIKATSTTGSWWVWDSARGITSTNDPALQLNSTAAEITSADAIDPSSSGFIVNQEATCSINASGVSYLVWAIA